MARVLLGNAFSPQMFDLGSAVIAKFTPVDISEIAAADFTSVVGHAETAAVLTGLLGREVEFNRVRATLNPDDILYVAQVTGTRLPEGATTLPEGTELTFLKVEQLPERI